MLWQGIELIFEMKGVKDRIKCIQKHIQKEIGKKKAVILVSGGIDSSVCAILSNRVISKQLYPICIRTGFNLNEEERNLIHLFEKFNIKVKILKKEKGYFTRLKNIKDPVKRRYTFGATSLEIIKKYAESINATVLINGVNKNDKKISNIVNSYKKRAKEVKEILGLKLVEPIANLYKIEIKEIAKQIGLEKLIHKQHIPGPALSVRIAGKITKEKLSLLKEINEFIDKNVRNNKQLWQYFPFLLDEKLDNRYLIVLRFVSSDDGFKAEPIYDDKLMKSLTKNILKKFPKVGRVFFDISPKPPTTIEFM